MLPLLEGDCHCGGKHLEQQFVRLLFLYLQLLSFLCEAEGEYLYGEGGVPDEEDNAGRDNDDEDEDGTSESLLLIS